MKKCLIGFEQIANKILTLLYPERCPFCDGILKRDERSVCEKCHQKLPIIQKDYCFKCGKRLEERAMEYCSDCQTKTHLYERGRILLANDEMVKKSIYRFKYGKRKAYARCYVDLMGNQFDDFICTIGEAVIVPVPLHFLRYQKRGYNQAFLLAKEFGKKYGISVCRNLVVRQINTSPQKLLDEAGRQNNLKKAFKIKRNDVKLDTIIVFDDIYTTGSTIDAISAVLLNSGFRKIYFIALAGGR